MFFTPDNTISTQYIDGDMLLGLVSVERTVDHPPRYSAVYDTIII